MSHTTSVLLIADQVIEIAGKEVNIHDIHAFIVNDQGLIIEVYLEKPGEE